MSVRTKAEAVAAMGLAPDANVWPTCGCSDDDDDPDCGGTGDALTCEGPRHPALLGLSPKGHLEHVGDPDQRWETEWIDDEPCRCPCHGERQNA